MQLLKMENDKLPKEICTYKIKKNIYSRRNLFYTALPKQWGNKHKFIRLQVCFVIVHELSYYNYEKCIFNNLIYIYQKILINMLEHFKSYPQNIDQ